MENKIKIELLRTMIFVREFEKEVSAAKLRNEINGQVHTCIGQEAVVVGSCLALSKDDYVISNHRSHGHVLAKGANVNYVMAELYGKITGTNGGKGGSMHIFDKEVGVICTTAIVGSGLPVGLGSAFASKYLKDNKITTVFFGDGATNEGTFGESLNLAATLKLPLIFMLENNGFAITTHFEKAALNTNIFERAISYGIKSFEVDGQNVEEVYEIVSLAVELIKNGQGPVFIEAKTHRFNEHAEGVHYEKITKTGYRDIKKIDELKVNCDPIINYSIQLQNEGIVHENEFQFIVQQEQQKVRNATIFAINSDTPSITDAFTNIYV